MDKVKSAHVDSVTLDGLLGIESSKIGYYSEVKQKIQELEAANLGLRTKRTELQAVFDAIIEGVVIYDSMGLVQHRNHVIPQLFPRQTLIQNSCGALFHPDRKTDPQNCPVEMALRGESAQMSFNSLTRGGQNRFFDITATTINDPSGAKRALLFIRDVTEKRDQELQLLQAEKMSSIGLLAAGVAHEINNPMTSVAVYAEALQRRFREAPEMADQEQLKDFPKYLDVIVREVYRCKGIIDNLLSFSRKSEGTFGAVNLNEVIGEVLELVRHKGRYEDISLDDRLQDAMPDIKGDASALRQVFLNLVLNAFQSISGEGQVRLETWAEDDQVVARVSDTGSGIQPDLLDQIWNPFFTTKVVGKGQGLGLAVTYDIIKKHEGDIRVESSVDVGTKFTVRLPKWQDN